MSAEAGLQEVAEFRVPERDVEGVTLQSAEHLKETQGKALTWTLIHSCLLLNSYHLIWLHTETCCEYRAAPRPGEPLSGSPYLSQCCQGFIDGRRLHQPLPLSFGLGDPFRSGKIAQGQRTARRESRHLVWALHLQRHHQVRPRTEEEQDVVISLLMKAAVFLPSSSRAAPLGVHLGRGNLSVLLACLHDVEDVGLGLDLDLGQARDGHWLPLGSDVQSGAGAFVQKVVQTVVINLQHRNLKKSKSSFTCLVRSDRRKFSGISSSFKGTERLLKTAQRNLFCNMSDVKL